MWQATKGNDPKMLELARKRGEMAAERDELLTVLEQTNWNRRRAAQILGVSEGTVRYRLKKHRIKVSD